MNHVRHFVFALMLIMVKSVFGYDFEKDGICYNIISSGEVEVTNRGTDFYSGVISIPQTVKYNGVRYSVTRIGIKAFYNCLNLRDVYIPNSVTIIGGEAFGFCRGLTSVNIPNSVTSIGINAFWYCTNLTTVIIPNSVRNIERGAFRDCTSLTSFTIPNSITRIAMDMFSGCTSLISVIIPNSVTNIGGGAFRDCTSLTSVTIPNSVISISGFSNCTSLTSIIIPNSVTNIGDGAFSGCIGLTSLNIPNSVTNIGASAFSGCTGLTSITIPDFVTSIEKKTFSNCTALESVVLSNSLVSINGSSYGDGAFQGCSSLHSITIPLTVTKIFCGTFHESGIYNDENNWYNEVLYIGDCLITDRLDTIVGEYAIKEGTRLIADYAFNDARRMTSVFIPNTVKIIGENAFGNCTSLSSINIPISVESISDDTFRGCTSLTSITIPNSVTNIGERAFSKCTSLTSVTIPNSVARIEHDAFASVPNIQYLGNATGSPWGARSINGYVEDCLVFSDYTKTTLLACSSVVTWALSIPNSVTNIGERAFSWCTGLTSITIPNSVTSIGRQAFYDTGIYNNESNWKNGVLYIDNCLIQARTIVPSIEIKQGTRLIAADAFSGCTGLNSIVCKVVVPHTASNTFTFYDVSQIHLFVPCGSENAYANASGWKDFGSINGVNLLINYEAHPSNEEYGSVLVIQQPNCENGSATLQAVPNEGCAFRNWTINGQVVSTANPYTLVVENGMEIVANFSGVGIDEDIENKIAISPNPAKDLVNIECENMKGIMLYTMDGRVARTYKLNTDAFTLDMTGMSKGIYVLRIETNAGVVINRKIVKE